MEIKIGQYAEVCESFIGHNGEDLLGCVGVVKEIQERASWVEFKKPPTATWVPNDILALEDGPVALAYSHDYENGPLVQEFSMRTMFIDLWTALTDLPSNPEASNPLNVRLDCKREGDSTHYRIRVWDKTMLLEADLRDVLALLADDEYVERGITCTVANNGIEIYVV